MGFRAIEHPVPLYWSMIAALKNRAAAEAVPVNTLAERLLQQTLATSVAGDEYRAFCAAPYTTLGQLYRKVVRAETVDGQVLSRAELRRLLRARQHGDRTRSHQGRHVSLHVPESGDIGLGLPNLRLRLAPDTFTALETDLLAHPAAAAALAELAALYGDLRP
ncbi:hypothetical protein V6X57_24560 [Serratia bockelmannii]|uniref:hypothetical protein n=1 Tax=Serratia bockelmannii TaxID=2703793 RepID=UPI002FE53E7F